MRPQKFIVETRFTYGWDDAGWTEDDKPLTFATRKAAIAAIDDLIHDQHAAVDAGHMTMYYDRGDYRVAPLKKKS